MNAEAGRVGSKEDPWFCDGVFFSRVLYHINCMFAVKYVAMMCVFLRIKYARVCAVSDGFRFVQGTRRVYLNLAMS